MEIYAPDLSHGITTPDEMIYEINRLKVALGKEKVDGRNLKCLEDRVKGLAKSLNLAEGKVYETKKMLDHEIEKNTRLEELVSQSRSKQEYIDKVITIIEKKLKFLVSSRASYKGKYKNQQALIKSYKLLVDRYKSSFWFRLKALFHPAVIDD